VARPAGRIAICKWGTPQENEFFAFLAALDGGIDLARLAGADPVSRAVDRLPLIVVATGSFAAPMTMPGDAALLGALTRAGLIAGADVLPDGIAHAARRFRRPDGSYHFDNRLRFWILTATGRRPPAPSRR
jgi:hypothetical protein